METERTIFDTLQDEIMRSNLQEAEKNRRLSALLKASSRHVNLMLIFNVFTGHYFVDDVYGIQEQGVS
ncbi:MAG: hypothetical protein FWB91_04060 [Defluviitaleaceae bacterium]|nr:hypothetical protein [Defluviitaleaceae bacterium]